MKRVGILLRKRFLFFGRNSGIHGLNHLFKENSNYLSRLFWLLILIASAGSLYLLLVSEEQLHTEVGFTSDTRYLEWTTTFPAVTVCEEFIATSVQKKFTEKYLQKTRIIKSAVQHHAKYTRELDGSNGNKSKMISSILSNDTKKNIATWNQDNNLHISLVAKVMEPLDFGYRRFLTNLLFFQPACNRPQTETCGKLVSCDLPWKNIIDDIHKNCNEIITDCSYNNEEFPCCDMFLTVDSEHGPCYSFNTLQRENFKGPLYTVNSTDGPGLLKFRLISNAVISIHSNEELSTNDLNLSFKKKVRIFEKNRIELLFSIVEIENDPSLRFQDISDRGCRYLDEVPDEPFHNYSVYSYGACRLAYNTKHLFDHCGCVHPVRDKIYDIKYCNYSGLRCLDCYEAQKSKLGVEKNYKEQNCLPSCVESELTTIHVFERWDPGVGIKGALVDVRMSSLPTLRYRRQLLRNHLDLVVSVGGVVGLFFSASILSLVEIFYLIFRTPDK